MKRIDTVIDVRTQAVKITSLISLSKAQSGAIISSSNDCFHAVLTRN